MHKGDDRLWHHKIINMHKRLDYQRTQNTMCLHVEEHRGGTLLHTRPPPWCCVLRSSRAGLQLRPHVPQRVAVPPTFQPITQEVADRRALVLSQLLARFLRFIVLCILRLRIPRFKTRFKGM